MSILDNLKAANATAKASGTFPIIKNSANGKMKNLKLFGASTKAEGQIESVVLNSIAAYGKNLFGFEKSAIDVTEELRKLDNQRLIFTKINDNSIKCNYSWGTYATGFVELNGIDGTKEYSFSFDVKNNALGFTPRIEKYTQECTSEKLVLSIYSGSGATEVSGNEYFILENIQVEEGTTATDFEPYKGNIANLPETFEMNGIEELKDYIDYERGVFVQKFGVVVFDGSDDENWKSSVTSVSGKFRNTTSFLKNLAKPYDITVVGNLLCTHYEAVASNSNGTWGAKQGLCIDGSSVVMVYDDSFNTENISLWKTHLQANPMTLVYELAEPIETPLSPAALFELNKLRTFDSITCVSNDAGAEMEIDYFKNNATGQEMSDIHAGVPRFILDGTTLNIIV